MRPSLCLAVVVGLMLAGRAPAESAPKKTSTSPSLQQLIEQLGSRDFHVRETASKAIAALGTNALPALQKSRNHPDPEVRRRLDELIPPLERAIALTPKRVTLHMTNKPINEIMNEIGKQTGYKIQASEAGGPNGGRLLYTFHFDKLPFWEALDKVCEASGIILQNGYFGDDALHLYAADSYVPFGCYQGPFKVVATGFYYNRNNNFGQLPRNPVQPGQNSYENLSVQLMVAAEPKIPIIRVGMPKLAVAIDDKKNSMLPTNGANNNGFGPHYYYGGYGRQYIHQTQANLLWPSKSSRTVKRLQGVIPVTLLADQKPAVVTDKILTSKNKKFKSGNATFHIEDVTEQPNKQYQIKINVTEEDKDNPNDWQRMQSMQQRIEVQDEKGTKYPGYVNITNWGGPSNMSFIMQLQPPGPNVGKPAKLVYYAWILMEHEVPFEFKELPLP